MPNNKYIYYCIFAYKLIKFFLDICLSYYVLFCLNLLRQTLKLHSYMENESIFKERPGSISFCEVRVIPSSSEKFYQLYRSGDPTPYVYSESHLGKCLECLEIKLGL